MKPTKLRISGLSNSTWTWQAIGPSSDMISKKFDEKGRKWTTRRDGGLDVVTGYSFSLVIVFCLCCPYNVNHWFLLYHTYAHLHTHTHSRWTRNFLTCRPTDISCEENDFNRTRAAFTFVYVRMCCACVWVPWNKGGGEETIRRPCYLLAIRVQASSVVSTCTFCQYSLAVRCFLRLSPSSFFTFLSTSFKSFSAYLRISLLLMVVVCCGQCAFSHFTC